jgi:hypothetical protein
VKNIYLTVQTGMVVRDLLRCGPLDRLLSHPEVRVVLLTPGVRDPAFLTEFEHPRVVIAAQHPYAPTPMVWRLMVRRWRYARSAWMADAIHRLEERFFAPRVPEYERLFEKYPPALVVSGDPLRPGDATLIASARRHGVPSLGSVRSWDNLLKHLRTRPDTLTVWNDRNRQEAVDVDCYRPQDVMVVGAPQLDPYFRPRVASQPTETKTIVLATSSFTYESDQTFLLDLLLEAIRSGEIRHLVQVVVRLHPDDRVGRYLKYRAAPEVRLDIPDRYLATLGWTMTPEDIERTADLLRHADLLVNFATTMTLEAAIVDTPTLLVAFSTIDPEEMERYVIGLHFRMHYRPLVERDLVPIAWSRADLVSWVNRYLDDPSLYSAQRATIVREWVQFTDGRSGERLGDAILREAGLEPPHARVAAAERPEEHAPVTLRRHAP